MAATYVIDEARRLVSSKASGTLTAAEIFDHQARLRADKAFKPDFRQIIDFTEVTEVNLQPDDMYRIADGSPFRAGARRAFIIRRPLLYGLARMFQILTEAHEAEIKIFCSVEEANEWLGLES